MKTKVLLTAVWFCFLLAAQGCGRCSRYKNYEAKEVALSEAQACEVAQQNLDGKTIDGYLELSSCKTLCGDQRTKKCALPLDFVSDFNTLNREVREPNQRTCPRPRIGDGGVAGTRLTCIAHDGVEDYGPRNGCPQD